VEGRIDAAFVCHLCLDADRRFTRARSVTRFDGVVRTLIHGFKYERNTWLAGDLVRLLASGWEVHFQDVDIDGVGWVPLHPTRRRTRGFNQARLLAEGLATRCGLPVFPGAVRRDRATSTQTNLNTRQRAQNVHGAFSCPRPARIAGKRLLLVDDVMTTGATVSEVSKVLLEAGAGAVYALTVARG
jgi:ComF family protein